MPGTTRYSATFDRPYEEEDEEDLPAVPPLTRRSRSASWQATTANGRPYTPLGGCRGSHVRSASTDNGPQSSSTTLSPAHSTERIPTRTTGKVPVKTSHNPFQFVKVGQCSLYKKAEEQLKKTQKVKQPEALKEEEEEWQTNLDSWKSRRRKMSQDVFRRQEEMKELLEMEVQEPVAQQKKVKTFSEMVEERASKGRTLSLCLFSNPLGLDEWSTKDGLKDDSEMSCNDTHQSSVSEESSNDNSEDESDVFHNTQTTERNGVKNVNNTQRTRRTGAVHFLGNLNGVNNGISSSTEENGSNCDFKVSDLTLNGETLSHKCEPCQSGAYNDSGLDSLSSSHRAGDIPDSGSDFSQDSGSSLDCDSPGITGIPTSGTELLEEFSSKDVRPSNGMISHKEKIDGMELCLKLTLTDGKSQQYGFTINGGKDKGSPVTVASVINGSISDLAGLKTGDHILAINKEDISSLSHSAVISLLKQSAESKQLELLVWRPVSTNVKQEKPTVNGSSKTASASTESPSKKPIAEQTTNKEISNKTNSKATKTTSVPVSSVDNRVDTVDSQSSNKKATLVKQKDVNCKAPTSEKSQTQETSGSVSEAEKGNAQTTASTAENQPARSVESENEMFVDDFHSAPVSNNSKIPVAEKSPKVMGKKMSKAPQESKKNKFPVSDSDKGEENTRKANATAVEDSKDNTLNIIYQSQPSVPKADSNAKELVSADSEHSADKKFANESPKSPSQTAANKKEPKFNDKLTFEASEILPVDKVAEQMERLILEQLEAEEQLKEKPMISEASLHGSVVTTTANVLSEHELSGIDTPPRQVEPPKEKPPPPPTSLSSTNKDSPLKRVNSTKRIKKEIQKRRSDFLGIEKPEEEESIIPPPPDLENILKLECEQERKVREMLGKESLHQRESSFEEEEIARKEREIIENLETEERIRMAKQTAKDESMSSPPSDASLAQTETERIRKLQEERVRMEEERFLKEEQRIRLEEERQLREREEQIRREEAQKPGDLSAPLTQSPCASVGKTSEIENSGNNMGKQKDASIGMSLNVNAGTTNKVTKSDTVQKSPTTTPVLATSPQIQVNETNKKPTFVKKIKQENKKAKVDKQNVSSKSDNKTSIKSEPPEPKSQVVQPSGAQSKMPENIPPTIEKAPKIKNSEISKSSDISQDTKENKTIAPLTADAMSDTSASKQKPKTPETCKNVQQNKQSSSQNDNVKNKRSVFEQKSKDLNVSQNTKQSKNTLSQKEGSKPNQQESEGLTVPPSVKQASQQNEDVKTKVLISKHKSPAFEVFQNAELKQKAGAPPYSDSDSVTSKKCPPMQESEILESSQNSDVQSVGTTTKTHIPEIKPKDTELPHAAEQGKVTVSQNVSSNSGPQAKHGSSQVVKNSEQKVTSPQSEGGHLKTVITEQKSEVSEISINTEQNKMSDKQNEIMMPKKNIPVQKLKVSDTSQNIEKKQNMSTVENPSNKACVSEQNSKIALASQNTEPSRDANLQGEAAKIDKGVSEQKPSGNVVSICTPEIKLKDTEFPPTAEQSKVSQSVSSNSRPQAKHGSSQGVQNPEQKVTSPQSEGGHLKTDSIEQKPEVSEVSLNTEQNKMCDKKNEIMMPNKNIPVQKPKVSDTSQNVEKKQNMLTVENSSNKACVSEQNSKMAAASQNTGLNKDANLQGEAAKTDKGVSEQKPSGNMVRVRKKKKGIPPRPIDSESCPELSNKTGKCPPSPTKRIKPDDKTVSSGAGQQNHENSSSTCTGARAGDVNSETKKVVASSQNESKKPVNVNQKSNPANGVSSITSSVTGQNSECKTSSNTKVESASDISATASSTAVPTNSENSALVSSISSSVSNDVSLSQTGDGKNKDTACMPSASGDQSSIAKETTNNLVPTKPLKKKEVIRKERERLRQEQEALQREREEYRRQLMKEQELLKESQKPHAPDAPVSRVGAPPPLKPALPLPLTSLPHASQALKENVIYTSRSPPANSVSAAVGNHGAASQNPSVLSPPHNAAARSKATQNDARGSHKVPVKKQLDTSSESRYNQNHWLIQEAEMRRISEQKERQRALQSGEPRCAPAPFSQGQYHPMQMAEENYCGAMPGAHQKPPAIPGAPSLLNKPPSNYPVPTQMHPPEQQWNYGQPVHPNPPTRKFPISNVLSPGTEKVQPPTFSRNGRVDQSMQAPTKPSRVIPMDRQEQMLSVSGRKRCSHCGEELGRGAAMIIESLQLYYHIQCFRCCVCQAQLGNGSCGTDVRVRNNKLHCHNCYSNDEAGLKFSQV